MSQVPLVIDVLILSLMMPFLFFVGPSPHKPSDPPEFMANSLNLTMLGQKQNKHCSFYSLSGLNPDKNWTKSAVVFEGLYDKILGCFT